MRYPVTSMLVAAGLVLSAADAVEASKCSSVRYVEAAKRISLVATCWATGVQRGILPSNACLARAERRFDSHWANAARKGDCPADVAGDAAAASADGFVHDLVRAFGAANGEGASRCVARKIKEVGRAVAAELGCWAKASPADPRCVDRADARRVAKWERASSYGDCFPTGVADDAALARHAMDAIVAEMQTHMRGDRVVRGVAVVVDLADAALEDFVGAPPNAITRQGQFLDWLLQAEDHWRWASVGHEYMAWDMTRVTLSQTLASESFPGGWGEFRTTAAVRTIAQLGGVDYDANDDGVVDAIFMLVSNHGQVPTWLVGGTSGNGGASVFIDGQDSGTIQGRAVGNLNHEVGHTRGLPDLYGNFDDINVLTLMSSSWALPPIGFSAWDRIRLGWVTPTVIDASTTGVELRSAEEHLEAVVVPTARASEYFVLEYRKRPDSGYGSGASAAYDGLAIYHVYENAAANNNVLPVRMRLEPPDGGYRWAVEVGKDDFWYPGNPKMQGPFRGKPYYAETETAVEIDNVARTASGSIRFDVRVFDVPLPGTYAPNPVVNGDFEIDVLGWTAESYVFGAAFGWDESCGVGGSGCARLETTVPNGAWWKQTVTGLTPGQTYRVSGKIKVTSITMGDATVGANLSLMNTFTHSTPLNVVADWKSASFDFNASATTAEIACRLGMYGSTLIGSILCDDITIAWVP